MNGLLDYFKGNARNLWRELKSAPQELKDLFTGKHNYQIREAMKRGGQIDPNVGAQYAMDFLQTTPVGALGKIVYHGSPHKFDKFDRTSPPV